MNKYCIIFLIVPLLGGCISTNTPGDLTLVSVEAVDWHDQAELPGSGSSPLVGMVKNSVIENSGLSVLGGEKQHRLMLKISFSSDVNLADFIITHSYNIGNQAFFCSHEENSPHMSYPYVYRHGTRISQLEDDPLQSVSALPGEKFLYYAFLVVSGKEKPQDIPPQIAFDLKKNPEDVCFNLRGGNESGNGFRSNTVIIPKNAIAQALDKLQNE